MTIKKPERPDIFAPTSISKRIHETIDFAVRARRTAVIIGPAGIGKSAAIADYCTSDAKAFSFELVQTKKSLKRLAELVCSTFNIYTSREFTSDIFDVLMDRLSDEVRLGYFLIIDEIQNAGLDGIRMLLSLHEHTRMPMILVGNPAAIRRTHANSAVFDQIEDRIGRWVILERPLPEDLRSIGIDYGVEGKDAFDALVAYGTNSSSDGARPTIRKAVRLLQDARQLAGDKGSIRYHHLMVAATFIHENRSEATKLLSSH